MRDDDRTKDEWNRLFDLLDTALELEPAARESWLRGLKDVPDSLKERLRDLLAQRSRVQQEGFLETPAAQPPPAAFASRPPAVNPGTPLPSALATRASSDESTMPPRFEDSTLAPRGEQSTMPPQPAKLAPAVKASASLGARVSAAAAKPFVDAPYATEAPTHVRDLSVLPNRNPEPESASEPRVGMTIKGRYTLTEELGQGGMGRVYKARDERRVEAEDRQPYVALKVLSEDFKEHPDAFIALQREGKRAQELAHPNVITVHDFDRDGPLVFMTMEYLQGMALDARLKGDLAGGMEVSVAWPIIRGIGAALEYGHSKKIVHCDMKPSNVFICKDGGVKVLDFGIARPMTGHDPEGEDTRFDPGKRLGGLTPAYASLEMWAREEPDPRDDIYAFACVIYQLLAGKHPFGSKSARAVRDEKLAPKRIDSLSRSQWDALRKGLALHRDARIPTVGQLIAPFAPSSFVRRHLLSMGAAAAALALGALTIGAHLYRDYIEQETIGGTDEGPAPLHNTVLSPEQQQDVDGKLDLAQEYFASVSLDGPPDEILAALSDGAFGVTQILDDVLATDPGNPTALKLRRKVVDIYSRKARQLADKGDIKTASRFVNAGLRLEPRHTALFLLRRDLCSKDATACR
jgi:hypothetical protein